MEETKIYTKTPQCPDCGSFFIVTYTPYDVDCDTGQLTYRCLDCLHRWKASKETWVDSPYDREEDNG